MRTHPVFLCLEGRRCVVIGGDAAAAAKASACLHAGAELVVIAPDDVLRMISKASVPDTSTMADGTVWVYWGDFTAVCSTSDLKLAERAPMQSAYETPDFTLSTPTPVSFPKEPFEKDTSLHYPTNGNPVALPDNAAKTALDGCLK